MCQGGDVFRLGLRQRGHRCSAGCERWGIHAHLVGITQQGEGKLSDSDKIEAAVFRRLLEHLDSRKDVQNIDLMNLAGFCRNCLSKWYVAAAADAGLALDYEQGRERVYGMPYDEWKAKYQTAATAEQLAAFDNRQKD
ncbi:MAG: DUF1244 domain-containing protein [Halioglobus sp.]|nr:DUF1244 domain-containing protein [Halioglobus sp.]